MQTVFLVVTIIFGVAFIAMFCWAVIKTDDSKFNVAVALFVVAFLCLAAYGVTKAHNNAEEKAKYEANIEIKQEKKKEIKYELLLFEDSEKLQGWETRGEGDGTCLFLYKNESYNTEGEVTYKVTYQFYYVKNPNTGEVGRMELNADTTKIFLIENGETPYLLETVIQTYTVDNNKNPPTTTSGGEIITYSLYISRESIAGDIDIAA